MGNSPSHLSSISGSSNANFEVNSGHWWLNGGFFLGDFVSDLLGVEYDKTLGNSRLLKTIKCRHSEGILTIKVFVKPDQGVSLEKYAKFLAEERRVLADVENVCHYSEIIDKVQASYLIRQYFYSNLYDRISTRPFLQSLDKKWITFQLLTGLKESHERKVYHGDLKAENVVVTSWNWVYITDFSSYKPTYLTDNNPEDFGIFFDSSGRRVCNVAPERFYGPTTRSVVEKVDLGLCLLDEKMDIFSLGCVLAELYLEGQPLFSYSQLLSYRRGEYSPAALIKGIQDPEARQLVEHMIQLDPHKRLTAEGYLKQQAGKLFPHSFHLFMHPFFAKLVRESKTNLTSWNYYSKPLQCLVKCSSDEFFATIARQWPMLEASNYITQDTAPLLVQFILSQYRGLLFPQSALTAIHLLDKLLVHLEAPLVLDRILPFVCYSLQCSNSLLCKVLLDFLCRLFELLKAQKSLDETTILETVQLFVLPFLSSTAKDGGECVRVSLVKCLAAICDLLSSNPLIKDEQLHPVRILLSELFLLLVASDSPHIIGAWVSHIGPCAALMGSQKSCDLFLSHMVTLLNHKSWKLRDCFAKSVPQLFPALDTLTLENFLLPLLSQSLFDKSPAVAKSTICSLLWLLKNNCLSTNDTRQLFYDSLPYLLHYDAYLRQSVVQFCCEVFPRMPLLTFRCQLYPKLSIFLRYELGLVDKESLLEAVLPPLHPKTFLRLETLFAAYKTESTNETSEFFRAMEQEVCVLKPKDSKKLCHALIPMLANRGRQSFTKQQSICEVGEMIRQNRLVQKWKVTLKNYNVTPHTEFLDSIGATDMHLGSPAVKPCDEMKFMGDLSARTYLKKVKQKLFPTDLLADYRVDLYSQTAVFPGKGLVRSLETSGRGLQIPSGMLACQFAEHSGEVVCSALSPCGTFFVTGSADGTLKIWDCARLEHSATSHSCATYTHERSSVKKSPITCVSFVENTTCIVSAAQTGSIHLWVVPVFHISRPSFPKYARPFLLHAHQLKDGDYAVSVSSYTLSSSKEVAICYVTFSGKVALYLPSSQSIIWTIQHPISCGRLTASLLSKCKSFLVVSTHTGVISLFDLRFRILVSQFRHPSKSKINQMEFFQSTDYTGEPRCIIICSERSALEGVVGEISVWDLDQTVCVKFWGMANPASDDTSLFAGTEVCISKDSITDSLAVLSVPQKPNIGDTDALNRLSQSLLGTSTKQLAPFVHSFVQLLEAGPSIIFALSDRRIFIWSALANAPSFTNELSVLSLIAPPSSSYNSNLANLFIGYSSNNALINNLLHESQRTSTFNLYQLKLHQASELLGKHCGRNLHHLSYNCPAFSDLFSGPMLYLQRPYPCLITCCYDGSIRVWK